ncbi:MAG: hypothetical protein IKL87_06135 [Oscillospiraceae bacterium]|nr:hypothetical protein [Oscillospiraceae bacterium]
MFQSSDCGYDDAALTARGESLDALLQEAHISEQDKQNALMEYLELLHSKRAAKVGVEFAERLMDRVYQAFLAHPTSEVAVDLLYNCLLVQQFHAMNFDQWRSHPSIVKCENALASLEADGRLSDCFRFCQETAATYADARFWPEALRYATRAHGYSKQLIQKKITVLENDEMLDLRDTACLICEYALHTAEGLTERLEAMLQSDLGAENFAFVLQEAQDNVDDIIVDPVEFTPEYLAIRYELEEKIDDALEHQRGYYEYCKDYWMAKRLILRSEFGISWKSPAALNPNMDFDG